MKGKIYFVFVILVFTAAGCQRHSQFPPLIRATVRSNVSEVASLLRRGEDVNQRDNAGRTALIYAAKIRNASLANLLLQHGANFDAVSVSGRSALMDAAGYGNVEITRMLLSAGANVHLRDHANQTALLLAAHAGHHEVVMAVSQSGCTKEELIEAFIAAAGQGHSRIVEHFISLGVAPSARNRYGVSAYSVASNNGQQNVLRLLVSAKKNK